MDYSKAIRIARSLADIPQKELARRISIDASLISMIESGKRKPTRDVLERIAEALDMPFHLLALLATEADDLGSNDSESLHRLAVGLGKLLLRGGEHASGNSRSASSGRETEHSLRKPPGRSPANPRRKTA
jgi:transcriptional regulator with XRE-family HTH domain